MEHIGQGVVDKHYCSFQIFECDSGSWQGSDEVSVSIKPGFVGLDKLVSFFERLDVAEIAQNSAQIPSSLGLGVGSKPPHSLMLDVVEAALDLGIRPHGSDSVHDGFLAVHRGKSRVKTLVAQAHQPGMHTAKTLFTGVDVGDDRLSFGVHETDKAPVFVEVRAVIDKVLKL